MTNLLAAQLEQVTAERNRWQERAFDLGNGMMEAMAERDAARREAHGNLRMWQMFDKLTTDFWADLIATKAELAALKHERQTMPPEIQP